MARPSWRPWASQAARWPQRGYRASRGLLELCHVCVDDATRLAFAEVPANERARTAVVFLRRCFAFCRAYGFASGG